MMDFITIKTAIKNLLGNAAGNRYTVAGFQKQSKAAEETKDNSRLVQVYYYRGVFPKRGGSMHGPNDHDMTFKINFTVSSAALADVDTLNNPNASLAQVQAAINNMAVAGELSDDSMDELFEIIYQVIMNAKNIDLGLANDIVASRWITDFQKDEPVQRGELFLLTGSCNLTCKASEDIEGETPIPGNNISTDFSIKDDLGDNAGVSVDPTT